MTPLEQQLLQRQGPVLPTTTPRVPTKTQRYVNAQNIQDAYRNGWQPNPVLLQVQGKT